MIVSYVFKLMWNKMESPDTRHTLFFFIGMLSIVLLIQYFYKQIKHLNALPPGPWGLPVIGYLTFIGNEKHTSFMELSKKYGSIFSATLGRQLTVVLSDYKLIRDVFKKEEFTGRPDTPFMQTLNGFGIINSAGKLWKDQRKFLHEKLRQFGVTCIGSGKEQMEKRIMTEVDEFLSTLSSKSVNNETIDLSPILAISVSNVICNIMMSVRFSLDDPKFKRFTFLIEEGMRLFGEIITVDYIPSVQYIPTKFNAKKKIQQNREEMFQFYREVIADHKATFDPENLRDLVDTYLFEIEKANDEGRSSELFEGKDHDQQIMQVMGDLFSAGMETVKTTLLWMNVFMLRNPEAMLRVQEELDQVVGRQRLPQIEDLPYLPVTESTICEVLRRSTIVPLGTTHSPTRDVKLNGYTIPEGSCVVPLINSIHMDPTLWDKPEEFNPSRFINAEGKVRKPEYFMPFGVGRRMCLGDALARMELFLFFSSMLHSFHITLPDGEQMPSLKGNVGVTITPQAFKVKLIPRPLVLEQTPIRNFGSN